jgi:hypothetical protein
MIKQILIFAVGAAIGFAGGGFVVKRKYEALLAERDKALQDMDEYYQGKLYGNEDQEPAVEETKEKAEEDAPKKVSSSIIPEKRKGSFATPYEKMYGAKLYEVEADPAETEHPDDGEPVLEKAKRNPKIITEDRFGTMGYSTRVLYYYTEDDDLVPEGENFGEVIDADEVKDMIGNALIKYGFADEGNLEREIFVRNENRKTDYRIIKIYGSLSEDLEGK